jgi:hypothetical protein
MTILFLEDWDKHKSAIVDTTTTNQSFLRLSALYRDMGIKNHSFILQLHNPELQGIDPYSNELTIEQMILIGIECKSNFFYFLRECMLVPGTGYNNKQRFKANRGNIALYWSFFNHITTILIQPRQTGKSFSTDVLMTYLLNIGCTYTEINLMTKDDDLRSRNLERLKLLELEMPFYLKQRIKGEVGNTEMLKIKSLNNIYKGHLPNKSPKMALNVGRGLTSPIFHIDEAAFFYNIGITLPAALAAGTAERNLAKEKNEPYGTILTTTAGKKDDRDGAYVYNLLSESAVWTEKFFDSNDNESLNKLVRSNSIKGKIRINCTFNHRQLGYTDEWLRDAIEAAVSVGDDASRDFGNVWTSGSQQSPLPVKTATTIRDSQVVEYYAEISPPYSYITRWYVPSNEIERVMSTNHHIMSLDTSDASGGDDIGMHLRDVKTGATIACGDYNETNLISFCEWICKWLVKYENITLIIERKSTGAMIIDYLLLMLPEKGIDPFKRLYNKVVQEYMEQPDKFAEINKPGYMRSPELYTKYKKYFGFATSSTGSTSRSELYSTTLRLAAKITGDKVRDPILIDQILGLVIKNGRVDHTDGGHDDLVISWLLSFWLLTQGKNLSFYGIKSRDVLIDNAVNMEDNDPKKAYIRNEQEHYRKQVEDLIETIKKEKDDFIAHKLECQLKTIVNKLSDDDKQIVSIDDLITNLREFRRSTHRPKNRWY